MLHRSSPVTLSSRPFIWSGEIDQKSRSSVLSECLCLRRACRRLSGTGVASITEATGAVSCWKG